MAKQDIYDDPIFFDGYMKIREKEDNANDLFEIPALLTLLPDLSGKSLLDLGCGYGEHCKMFINMGAANVVGVDISEKMLEVAHRANSVPKITYLNIPIEDIDKLEEQFDVVVSSLAIHYVESFAEVVKKIYDKMNTGGVFVFSQEHPIATAYSSGNRWTKDENGKKLYVNLSNYCVEGERELTWFVNGVKKYHRTFSTIVNTLVEVGFTIERMIEPFPDAEMLKKHPQHDNLLHKPDFLLVKAKKM